MGRLSEYDEADRRAILGDVTPEEEASAELFWKDAQLGARVREMLASEEPPEWFRSAVLGRPAGMGSASAGWKSFRDQLLEPVHPPVTDFMQTLKDAIRRQGEAEEDANGR
jgi:hypothetical protein